MEPIIEEVNKVETFVGAKSGRIVYLRTPVSAKGQDIGPSPRFFARVTVEAEMPDKTVRKIPFEFTFPENFNVLECFANFEQVAQQQLLASQNAPDTIPIRAEKSNE